MFRLSLAAVALIAVAVRADDNKPPAGFTALFNGKDLTGWQGNIDMKQRATMPPEKQAELVKARTKTALENWTVKDGVIHHTGKGGVSLQTAKDYANFELMLDWKIEAKGDSGIYLRGQPQVQIWDSENAGGARNEDKNSGSGGLWNNPFPAGLAKDADNEAKLKAGRSVGKIPLKKADKPVGEWNTFHITVIGEDVSVKLNGELVVAKAKLLNYFGDRNKPAPAFGPIELQYHGDPLWFKNLYVKELK
jgi:Domain of Unknown Function (DUF1080)